MRTQLTKGTRVMITAIPFKGTIGVAQGHKRSVLGHKQVLVLIGGGFLHGGPRVVRVHPRQVKEIVTV